MDKIDLCKKCKKRKLDFNQGIICGLTNKKPDFENICPNFEKDETIKDETKINLKPNKQRAKTAIILIWIVLSFEIISFISNLMQYNLLQIILNGGYVSVETANANDLRVTIISFIFLIVYIISGITFIMWFRRAYYNLHQKVKGLSFSEGWAAGCWFVPFVNLGRPYRIMKELFKETKEFLTNKGHNINEILKTDILIWWWVIWIFNGVIGQFAYNYSKNAKSIDELIIVSIILLIGNITGILAALITIKIIKKYSSVELQLNETEIIGNKL